MKKSTILSKMPLWNLGFRPFFLFGVVWATLQIGIWVSFQNGWLKFVSLDNPIIWHAHEMVFGYTLAIVAGFLLTASQNWTGIPGLRGAPLFYLFMSWAVPRLFSLFWGEFLLAFALLDLVFVPALFYALYPYLSLPHQKQNRIFFLLFAALFFSNLLVHLSLQGFSFIPALGAIHFAIYICVGMIIVIGGRVIPFFAGVVLPDIKVKPLPVLENLSSISFVLFSLVAAFTSSIFLLTIFCAIAFFSQLFRWWRWKPWRAYSEPILFILYVAYLWIPVGILMTGLSKLGLVLPSLSTHAFTVGSIGVMIFGMICRVSLGHTGRSIRPNKYIVFSFHLIFCASILRVFAPWLFPGHTLRIIEVAATLWILTHLVFLYFYTPILLSKRADGRDG